MAPSASTVARSYSSNLSIEMRMSSSLKAKELCQNKMKELPEEEDNTFMYNWIPPILPGSYDPKAVLQKAVLLGRECTSQVLLSTESQDGIFY